MSFIEIKPKVYDDGCTKQTFKKQCDITNIMQQFQRKGTITHLERREAQYADFSDVENLEVAMQRIERGTEIFEELPSELRREFGNNPFQFFRYVNAPENRGRLKELLPALAEPGRQNPAVTRGPRSEADPQQVDMPEDPPAEPAVQPSGGEVPDVT